jgi:acyl-CoA dehydrogenase
MAVAPATGETSPGGGRGMIARAKRIGSEVARPAAARVDRQGSFPREALGALREEKLLSAGIPREFGGGGATLSELAQICTLLGRNCAATGMIFAMHQMQIGCISRHLGENGFLRDYLANAAKNQWLLASGTSEVGVGGDLRTSIAAIELAGDRFKLQKLCTTVSYGEQADGILITARRDAAAAPGDQVLALIRRQDYELQKTGEWDVLGMRGTCSPAFTVTASAASEQIVPEPFREIAIQTMIPYSHVLWSAVWLGIAADVIAIARSAVKQAARKSPKSTPLASPKLAEALGNVLQMKASVIGAAAEFDRAAANAGSAGELATPDYGLRINHLKLGSSRLVVEICLQCLQTCGIAGYANNSPMSLGRQLRDALSAPLMISDHRLRQTNVGLLQVASGGGLEDY